VKIYTKTGDQGWTGLFRGPRVRKDDLRITAYGELDELNAVLGMVRAADVPAEVETVLNRVQHELFELGAELATPQAVEAGMATLQPAQVLALEDEIDRWDARLPALQNFILPGGSPAGATLHLARTVCRRVERSVITLQAAEGTAVRPLVVEYLNRLGDALFVLARAANQLAGRPETIWQRRTDS